MGKIVIDPVTRIEGHLKIECVVEGGVVGGVVGGVLGGTLGGTLGAVKTVYWSAVQEKNRVKPQFPEAARQLNMEGDCAVKINIDDKGVPISAEATKCPELFKDAAIKAAMASRFYPYKDNGMSTAVQFTYNYRFKLQ